jgi:O-antigen ligase
MQIAQISFPKLQAPNPEPKAVMSRATKVVWGLFAATCIQLTFLKPYFTLVPGHRTNLFSALLCFLSLAAALSLRKKDAANFKSPEFLISLALVALAGLSPIFSLAPLPSSFRVFALVASAAGGFWCARILLATPENQRLFVRLSLLLLAGLICISISGYFVSGDIDFFFHAGNTHPHQDMIFLLSFAPLTLLWDRSPRWRRLGIILLALSYVPLCLSERVSVIFIPLAVLILAALFSSLRWQHVLLILVFAALVAGFFQHQIWWTKLSPAYPSYRLENFPFSWSIARQHPLFGIGLRSPREQFLENYQVKYPYTDKEEFAKVVAKIVTADNTFLTFMAGLGLPFTLLYAAAVLILMAKLVGLAFRPPPGLGLPPLALLLPLAMALVHFQLYDGLLFVQNSWFFHILLGLIPLEAGVRVREAALQPAQI